MLHHYDPYQIWRRMDNYIAHVLREHPATDPSRLKQFLYQFLLKVSNICMEDALRFKQPLSMWNPPGRGDYQRFYHVNPILLGIEAELKRRLQAEDLLLVSHRRSFEEAASRSLLQGRKGVFAKVEGQEALLMPQSEGREQVHQFLIERGLTPTLQQAAGVAARLGLAQPHASHEFPEQYPPQHCFSALIEHAIFLQFKQLHLLQVSFLVQVLEGCANLALDEAFRERGLESVLQDSYGRILFHMDEALKIDLSRYENVARLESCLDLVYEEMLLWLMVAEPYAEGALEKSIQKTIAPPAFLRVVPTGMTAFSDILRVVLETDRTILLYDGCYFENRATLLKSFPESAFYLVRFPHYEASLQENFQRLEREGKTIDLLIINFHENLLKGRYAQRGNDIASNLEEILRSGCASASLTVVIDTTIGFLASRDTSELLQRFQSHIDSQALHIVILWSNHKLDQFGIDKLTAGTYCVYSKNATLLERFRMLHSEELDFVSRQGFSHFFAVAPSRLEERRKRIFSNAHHVNSNIAEELKYNPEKGDQPIWVVVKDDEQNFSVDVQFEADRELDLCKAFQERGIPLMVRSGFGGNLTSVAFTTFQMARFSIGIEEPKFLNQFVTAFNEIFLSWMRESS